MPKSYYTYRITVSDNQRVQVEKLDSRNDSLGQGSGRFRYQDTINPQVKELLRITQENELNDSSESRVLGEALFNVLFDDVLCHNFVNFYDQVVSKEKQLLRVELKIDEQSMPEVASLPWEFMCVPQRFNLGTIWLGTSPHLVFSRCPPQWIPAQAIQLHKNERLRVALVISAPKNLGAVAYEKVQGELETLAKQGVGVDLLPVVNSANPEYIDDVLAKNPHIFHFIGHGRLKNKFGEIAFVDDIGEAMWVDADYFSGLFNRHRPGVVMLQACEGGMQSTSQAFVGVASRVVQQNIPVVVAMQYEVSNSTANRFSRRFYQELAKGNPVDIAAQEGRYAIALSLKQYKKRDFATPVIFVRVANGYLFDWSGDGSKVQPVIEEDVSDPPKIIKTPEPKQPTFQFDIATIEVEQLGLFGDNKITIKRRRHQAQYFSEDFGNGIFLEMVAIPGGTFTMGAPETEAESMESERPQHQVTVNPFSMGKYPITQAQWQAVAAAPQINRELNPDPSYFKGSDRPVEQVSWYDVVEFCDRLAKATGRDYRLPSEAEWEYACRAGTNTPFHFGETITTDLANYDGTDDKENKWSGSYGRGPKGIYRQETTPVGSFQVANAFGLYDMHGNVWEWCADKWHENYQAAPSNGSGWISKPDEEYRLLRGGSWNDNPRNCRSACRNWFGPGIRNYNIGFRVVVSGARTA